MKKLTAAGIIILLFFLGCQSENDKEDETTIPVSVFVARPDSISQNLKLTGGIEAVNDAIVYSKISEKIDSILVRSGDKVKADQLLAVQSNQLLFEGVNVAQAALGNARAQYEMMQKNYERMQRLFSEQAISQQRFDQEETQFKLAEAGLEQARAHLGQAREQYENSFVKAPFSGTVAMIFFDEGQTAPAGQPVAKIVDTRQMKAKLYVPEVEVSSISVGQKAIIKFPALPEKQFFGVLYRIDEAIDPVKRALEIEVRITNNGTILKSGMFGQFLVETKHRTNTIVLVDNAIMTQTEVELDPETGEQKSVKRHFVYTIKDGKARMQDVVPGIYYHGKIEVTSGLSFGDSVVVVGQNIIKDGDLVKIAN